MIGKNVLSFRYLKNNIGSDSTKRIFILNIAPFRVFYGECIEKDGAILFFNNLSGKTPDKLIPSEMGKFSYLLTKYSYYRVFLSFNDIIGYGRSVIMLPDDFEEQYENFKKMNGKNIKSIFCSLCGENDPISKFLFSVSSNSFNIYSWAITNIFKRGVSFSNILYVLSWFGNNNKFANKLSKGTITAYNSSEDVINLINEIIEIRRLKRVNDVINSFNTVQKKLLKSYTINDKFIEILSKFSRLTDVKKLNFIRKMSTIEDVEDILKQMSQLVDIHFEWNKESLLNYIETNEVIKAEVVLSGDSFVLVKVFDYESIKRLAKTTNWCISKNKSYWNNYIEHNRNSIQFILFDFSKKEDDELSIVGFTAIKNNGIRHAHSFTNNNLMFRSQSENVNLVSMLNSGNNNPNIFSILKSKNISVNKLIEIDSDIKHYEWNLTSFLSFLNYLVDEDKYTIYHLDESSLCIKIKDDNVRLLIGDNYRRKLDYNYFTKYEHIFFFDFDTDEENENRILFGIVTKDNRNEETVNNIYNAECNACDEINFDELLEEYCLPYDIICRTSSPTKTLMNALSSFNIKKIDSIISDKELLFSILDKDESISDYIYNCLSDSIYNYYSFDVLNVIYNNGYKLCDIINICYIREFVSNLSYTINDFERRNRFRHPTDEDFEMMMEHRITNHMKIKYVFWNKIFQMILSNEDNNELFNDFLKRLDISRCNRQISKLICETSYGHVIFNFLTEAVQKFIYLLKQSCDDELAIKFITNTDIQSKDIIEYLKNSFMFDEKVRVCLNDKYSESNKITVGAL